MKIAFFVVLIFLLSVLARAFDLPEMARKEKARRQATIAARGGRLARFFSDSDLKRYQHLREDSPPMGRIISRPSTTTPDLGKQQEYWQKKKQKHRQNLAQIDARIRRMEWRLAQMKARKQTGKRLRKDPAEQVLEENLRFLREERSRHVEEFHEEARKAGAQPGWLR